jgi:carbonic anhydrase
MDHREGVRISRRRGRGIRVGGKRYELKQFHFHRPSEEKIDGHAFEMVVHLVHASADGNLAVVAVLLNKGDHNSLVHELWSDLPKEKGKEEVRETVQVDSNLLLPVDRARLAQSVVLNSSIPFSLPLQTWFDKTWKSGEFELVK